MPGVAKITVEVARRFQGSVSVVEIDSKPPSAS